MGMKYPLRERVSQVTGSAALVDVFAEPVEPDKIYCIQQLAWTVDKAMSGGNTRVRLYIAGHGYKHYIEEQDAPTADVLYTYAEPLWLLPGKKLALELDQAQATTAVEIFINGYWTDRTEGIL